MYQIEVRHPGLHKYRIIKGMDGRVVEEKARAQMAAWNEMWARRQDVEQRRSDRAAARQDVEAQKEEAAARTAEAQHAIEALAETLARGLSTDSVIDWEARKDTSTFQRAAPTAPAAPSVPREPHEADDAFRLRPTLWDRVIAMFSDTRERRQRSEMEARFAQAHAWWERQCDEIEQRAARDAAAHKADLARWEAARVDFQARQREANAEVDRQRDKYMGATPEAIADYCETVLSCSEYPSEFPQEFDLEYLAATKTLIVEYILPAPEHLPRVKSVQFTKGELAEKMLTEKESGVVYDGLLYQITLRTLHELFQADVGGAIETIVFNGWVASTDRTTGQPVRPCVLSVQAQRAEFQGINLAQVEPKACFRRLKGVGSSQLHGLAAIPPIQRISREDPRFVESHPVEAGLDPGSNLASMDWEEFEHLVREVFAKEFSGAGAEVKVTRASRDGGVDAIAFDPDPIRGGKIVIQAKRYTRTVDVSAVRDLYGTVMNEGAMKGILVTTADYGPDAYKFALGKPLQLLNGSNLLSLMEKHGRKVRIDLEEARRLAPKDPSHGEFGPTA